MIQQSVTLIFKVSILFPSYLIFFFQLAELFIMYALSRIRKYTPEEKENKKKIVYTYSYTVLLCSMYVSEYIGTYSYILSTYNAYYLHTYTYRRDIYAFKLSEKRDRIFY